VACIPTFLDSMRIISTRSDCSGSWTHPRTENMLHLPTECRVKRDFHMLMWIVWKHALCE
jgi:hypothetical protein